MMEDEEGKDENQAPVSEHFKLECAKKLGSKNFAQVYVGFHRYTNFLC
jgi:hypothetical protein